MTNITCFEATFTFIRHLADGRYQQAAVAFAPTMTRSMPSDVLRAGWEAIESTSGKFRDALDTRIDAHEVDAVVRTTVFVTLRHDHGKVAAYVVFDPDGKISGMGFAPGLATRQLAAS